MPSENTQLAEQIKQLRTSRSRSQKEVAASLGVSQPSYHALENGDTRPTLAHLLRLADFYGLPPAEAFPDYELSRDELEIVGQRWRENPSGTRLSDVHAA